jgi:hypothetical protein
MAPQTAMFLANAIIDDRRADAARQTQIHAAKAGALAPAGPGRWRRLLRTAPSGVGKR